MFSDILIYFQETTPLAGEQSNNSGNKHANNCAQQDHSFFFFLLLSYLKERQSEPVVISSGFKMNTEHIKCVKKKYSNKLFSPFMTRD